MKLLRVNTHSATLVLLVALLITFPQTSALAAVAGYDIIIVAGQSNAVGNGVGPFSDSYASSTLDTRIFGLGRYSTDSNRAIPATWTDGVQTYDALQHWDIKTNRATMGFAIPFARRYTAEQLKPGRAVLIVPTAYNGTSILKWLGETTTPTTTPNALYDDMRERVRTALGLPGSNKIVAFLWLQGETDINLAKNGTGIMSSSIYQQKLTTLLAKLRTDFPRQTFPVLAGKYVPELMPGDATKAAFEAVTARVFSADPKGGAIVSNTGLTSNMVYYTGPKNNFAAAVMALLHYNSASQVTLGSRFYAKWKVLKGQ